jgi:hypothetical protein
MENALRLYFLHVGFRMETLGSGRVPAFLGATLRGGFGTVFKSIACLRRASPPAHEGACERCERPGECPYSYVFETPITRPVARLQAEFAPHPFVLAPSDDHAGWAEDEGASQPFAPGDRLGVNLTLIGRGIAYLPFFVAAIGKLARQGLGGGQLPFRFVRAEVLDLDGAPSGEIPCDPFAIRDLPHRPATVADVLRHAAAAGGAPWRRASLELVSPLRLVTDGRAVRSVDMPVLMRAVLRRVSSLARAHCGNEPQVDYADLIRRSAAIRVRHEDRAWRERCRTSTRQHATMALGGLMGTLELEGDLQDILPWLLVAQHVGLGKGTSFGLGRFRVRLPALPAASLPVPAERPDAPSHPLEV